MVETNREFRDVCQLIRAEVAAVPATEIGDERLNSMRSCGMDFSLVLFLDYLFRLFDYYLSGMMLDSHSCEIIQ